MKTKYFYEYQLKTHILYSNLTESEANSVLLKTLECYDKA